MAKDKTQRVDAPNWLKIRTEYASTNISYRKLAEKHGVSVDAIKKRAASEKWTEERTKLAPVLHQKTVQKAVERIASSEADRLARILSIGDALLLKAERSIAELGEYYTVKRKETQECIPIKDENENLIGFKDIDETTEIAVKGVTVVDSAAVKRLASALKDLRDVIRVDEGTGNDTEALEKAKEMLGGVPSAF